MNYVSKILWRIMNCRALTRQWMIRIPLLIIVFSTFLNYYLTRGINNAAVEKPGKYVGVFIIFYCKLLKSFYLACEFINNFIFIISLFLDFFVHHLMSGAAFFLCSSCLCVSHELMKSAVLSYINYSSILYLKAPLTLRTSG